jgi:hypothetical protein
MSVAIRACTGFKSTYAMAAKIDFSLSSAWHLKRPSQNLPVALSFVFRVRAARNHRPRVNAAGENTAKVQNSCFNPRTSVIWQESLIGLNRNWRSPWHEYTCSTRLAAPGASCLPQRRPSHVEPCFLYQPTGVRLARRAGAAGCGLARVGRDNF